MRTINIVGIAVLMAHSLPAQLTREGAVFTWGLNEFGQLGRNATQSSVPGLALQAYGFKQVSAGVNHTVGLKADGTVWTWGRNDEGQLGNGTQTDSNRPVQVKNYLGIPLSDVTAVSAGGGFSLALKSDGTVHSWGRNAEGQLGVGLQDLRFLLATPALINNVTAISAGGWHSLALRNDGTVLAWGSNARGQLGNGTVGARTGFPTRSSCRIHCLPRQPSRRSSAGAKHNLAIKTDGVVVSWGDNSYGQVGPQFIRAEIGPAADHCNPVPLPVIASHDGTAFVSPATAIGAGGGFSLAIVNQQILAWGRNDKGQLARGNVNNSPNDVVWPALGLLPTGAAEIAAGSNHALARLANGLIYSWGDNSMGQLGLSSATNSFYSTSCFCATAAQIVSARSTSLSIAAGAYHSVTVLAPELVTEPSTMDFGVLPVGSSSTTHSIVVKNYGPGPVTIAPVNSRSGFMTLIPAISATGTNAADFKVQVPFIPTPLEEGASVLVQVYFQPQAVGTREAYLTVVNNGWSSPAKAKLTGTAAVIKAR